MQPSQLELPIMIYIYILKLGSSQGCILCVVIAIYMDDGQKTICCRHPCLSNLIIISIRCGPAHRLKGHVNFCMYVKGPPIFPNPACTEACKLTSTEHFEGVSIFSGRASRSSSLSDLATFLRMVVRPESTRGSCAVALVASYLVSYERNGFLRVYFSILNKRIVTVVRETKIWTPKSEVE